MGRLAVLAGALLTLLPAELAGQVLHLARQDQWQTWSFPRGTIDLRDDGSVRMAYSRRHTDPLLDAAEFEHKTLKSGMVRGGIKARSRAGAARYLSDRDRGTWWQPDPADGLDNWLVEVDLGRVVLLEKIRLVFPDTVGARPFRDFSVFVSEGSTVSAVADLYRFTRAATTTRPNTERVLEYDLSTLDRGNKATGETLVTSDTLGFMPVQFLRFVPHQPTQDAALAEVELLAVGDNIGLGTFARGGTIRAGDKFAPTAPAVFDGTVDGYWNVSAARAAEAFWRTGGQWFEWDLGAAFWLDEIVLYTWDPVEMGRGAFLADSGQLGYELSVSDGRRIAFAGGSEDRIRGNHDYEVLSMVNNTATARRWIFDHRFGRRKVRDIFYHHDLSTDRYGFNMFEVFLYGQGYPAAVELVSDFIDLASPRSFTALSWEADLPPRTSLELRTRTGDLLDAERRYYHKNGKELSKEQWDKLPEVVRGAVQELVREGADWSGWSDLYVEPGEAFRSPTPRRYVRIQAILSTDDPQVTPVVRSLSLSYQEPLVRKGVAAEVFPREGPVGVWQEFSYRIRPQYTAGDRGFDGVLIAVPSQVRDVAVVSGGKLHLVPPVTAGDTLRVALPGLVRNDSVEVRFTARPLANPTLFRAFLTHSAEPAWRQEVKPAHRDALKVFLPAVAEDARIIANAVLVPEVVTPNGDGVNDVCALSFDLLKVEAAPRVRIFDLNGRPIRELAGRPGAVQRYEWDARAADGALAAPGVYIWHVELDAGIGTQQANRLVHVLY